MPQAEVTIPEAVTLSGDVHLILADGCALTIEGGITGSGSLTVYAQSTGNQMGRLTATGNAVSGEGSVSAGIFATNITIDGGTVNATGGDADGYYPESRGICAGQAAITDGVVTATGGAATRDAETEPSPYNKASSAGIVARYGIEISDGNITATGSEDADVSAGVYVYSQNADATVSLSGHAALVATGKRSGGKSYGLCVEANYSTDAVLASVQVTGGDLNVICFGADESSYGIYTATVYRPSEGEPTVQDVPGLSISGGHVRVHNVDEGRQDHSALNAQPDLSGYGGYMWRTGMEDSFTPSTTPYEYSPTHSFVEFGGAAIYGVSVNGVEVGEINYGDVLSDGVNDGKVSYDPATNTLTVSGALTYDTGMS